MKNIKNLEMFDRDMTKEELETQIIKTHGHYISVFNTEDQINNADLVFKAIDLDSSNLSRISEKFYCKYYSELSSLLDENTYNYFPDFVYDLHHFYIAKYLEVKKDRLNDIQASFFFKHKSSLQQAIIYNPILICGLPDAVQFELIDTVKRILKNDPSYIRYLSSAMIMENPDLVEEAIIADNKIAFILSDFFFNRYPDTLVHLSSNYIEEAALKGFVANDGTIYYPVIKNGQVISSLLKRSNHAIVFVSDWSLLIMNQKKLKHILENEALRNIFKDRHPLICKIKNIK